MYKKIYLLFSIAVKSKVQKKLKINSILYNFYCAIHIFIRI
ncbi:protein of unknown function [Bartonella clarridgeiae 73]|uniref:Uncharacterized protein n=1 Tax=Bartonella clarridgeiae (strain CCUG 45776 / CIP 104772 / 73) TaxID=696125 RepID=E6YFV7_BARC7|nr:protein of unknown function [Bartonella clarridgeiae 73]